MAVGADVAVGVIPAGKVGVGVAVGKVKLKAKVHLLVSFNVALPGSSVWAAGFDSGTFGATGFVPD